MAQQIKSALTRSPDTLLADVLGALSLMAMLFAALSLPSFV